MLDKIYQYVLTGNANQITGAVQEAVDAGQDPGDILNKGMIAAMEEVGRRFEAQDYFIPEMLVAARAMKMGLEILRPHLADSSIEPVGKVILGTVSGDLHDIGKNLVGMMLEGAGFEVVDLGTNVSSEKFVAAARDEQPQFVGISALLTTTMTGIRKTIEALEEAGLRGQLKVMVGGAPLTQEFANEIGADLYAADAASAAKLAKALL